MRTKDYSYIENYAPRPMLDLPLDIADSAPGRAVEPLVQSPRPERELYDLTVLRRIASTNPWLRVTAVSQEESDPWWINAVATPAELGIDHEIGTLADVVARSGDWQDRQVLIAGSPQMIENTRRTLIIAGVRASRIQHDPVF